MISPPDAWAFGRVLCDQPLNGELDTLAEPFKAMAVYLAAVPVANRQAHWQAMVAARPDRDELVKALADVDPLGPAPQVQPIRFATVADVRRLVATTPWTWELWIAANRIFGVGGFEGTGKTRFFMDLVRRIWHGLEWPDGQKATLPPGTPSLWLCADGHHDELVELLPAFDLPDEAVVFPATPEEPYEGTDLDQPDLIKPGGTLETAIATVKPGLVVIDSLTYATSRDLCSQDQMKTLKSPLVHLVQKYHTNIGLSLHLSLEGQALGRRIKGITKTLMHLECPDPEQPHRLRLWIEKSYGKKPPALGVSMGDHGNTYDFSPPARLDPSKSKGGRPAIERDKAMQFIRDALARQNNQIGNDLATEWTKGGGSTDTFWRAVKDLVTAGDIATDGGKGTGKQTILHLVDSKTAQPAQTPPNPP